MIIQTLAFIFGAIPIVSTLFTALLWHSYREPLLKTLFLFWASGLVSFILQGVFNLPDQLGFLAFASHIVCIYFLLSIYSKSVSLNLPWKNFGIILCIGLISSLALFQAHYAFQIATLPFSLTCFGLLNFTAYQGYKQSKEVLNLGFTFLLVLNALHFADYPFLRPNTEFAVLGFSIALGFYFSYSIYIPLYIMKKTADRHSANLENEVRKRTEQLTDLNTQLLNSNSSLETKNYELDHLAKENKTLLSLLVHDIATPLQILFNFVDKANLDKIHADLQVSRERALRAGKNIRDVISTVRGLHAVKLGKMNPQLKACNISDLVLESLLNYEEKLKEKNIKIEFDPDHAKNFYIEVDGAWVKNHILANLISNAIKFSDQQSEIQIRVFDDNSKVKIQVRDFGIGIPGHLKNKIFNIDEPTTRLGTSGEKGTGLGLPIVKEYTELLHGHIRLVDLKPEEKGTCFELEFNKPENLQVQAA